MSMSFPLCLNPECFPFQRLDSMHFPVLIFFLVCAGFTLLARTGLQYQGDKGLANASRSHRYVSNSHAF